MAAFNFFRKPPITPLKRMYYGEAAMKFFAQAILITLIWGTTHGTASAAMSFDPYVTIRSTKSIKPNSDEGTETAKVKQRQEAGLRFSLSFWKLMKFQFGIGQSVLTQTQTVNEVADEYGEIDFASDLDMSTDNPDQEVKTIDTQNRANLTFSFDPSFSIFILRFKLGVTAQQRIMEKQEAGLENVSVTKGPTYKPISGVGFGVRINPSMYFMAEYSAYHYEFPDPEPFERQVTVSYSIGI